MIYICLFLSFFLNKTMFKQKTEKKTLCFFLNIYIYIYLVCLFLCFFLNKTMFKPLCHTHTYIYIWAAQQAKLTADINIKYNPVDSETTTRTVMLISNPMDNERAKPHKSQFLKRSGESNLRPSAYQPRARLTTRPPGRLTPECGHQPCARLGKVKCVFVT